MYTKTNKQKIRIKIYIADNRRRYCLRTNLFTKICCKKNPLKVPGAQNEYEKFTLKRRKYSKRNIVKTDQIFISNMKEKHYF